MHILERWSIALRHSPPLDTATWLWDRVRPVYNKTVKMWGRNGLRRNINRTDPLLVLPQFRGVTETYEPEVWRHLMLQVRPGDTVADVGAFIGLYTIALSKRVGPTGRVVAFEPDPENFSVLKGHLKLNGVSNRVDLLHAAVGREDGLVPFAAGRSCESHVFSGSPGVTQTVECVSLDSVFVNRRLDILKIDVEGYEEEVLRGAVKLLGNTDCCPRVIYIEVHPYAWSELGTSSQSLLALLNRCNYNVLSLDGAPIEQIKSWGEIVASKSRTSVMSDSK